MPWKETTPMDQISQFVALANSGRYTITELCEDFGISRKTGHKYLRRYSEEGSLHLPFRSRRPLNSPARTDAEVEQLILQERRVRCTWGPKKLQNLLRIKHGIESPPAQSTIGLILKRHGLSQSRHRRPGVYRARPAELTDPTYPNEVWSVDFKGWFLLGNRERCDPLTVCDRCSRYVISCHACANQQFIGTLRVFKGIMRYYGLPYIIRVDNGTPFASSALGGLSRLSIWWIEQGIEVEFTRPAHPQDNGSHERMHRDLKAEATQPASANLAAQQRRFQRWRHEYNHERPHEALDMQKPADIYQPSKKRLNENDKITYPSDYLVKRVSPSGHIAFEGNKYYAGEIFAGCRVGLFFNNEKGHTEVHYANMHLGNLTYQQGDPFRPPASISPPPDKKS